MNFETFNLHPSIMAGVRALGYTIPTPIQAQAIPPILERKDLIGLAQTGTGKTAAFVLPILEHLRSGPRGKVRALIISPTRELAEQTHDVINGLGAATGLRSTAIYGGVGMEPQTRELRRGVDVITACPGRLLDHLWKGNITLTGLETLVIDEADRMFDMGFLPDIRNILKCILHKHQTLLFSATMPADIARLVREILHDPITVQVDRQLPAKTVSHFLYPVPQHLKTDLLREILYSTTTDSVLVFTRTKHRAERVAQQLKKDGFRAVALQGDMSQSQRQFAFDGFRNGSFKVLVATDIAARGLDVLSISHVINYDIPDDSDAYIHRIGRTGRISQKGCALTFVTSEDMGMVRDIEHLLNAKLERRTVSNFDYAAPAPKRNPILAPRPMRRGKAFIPRLAGV